MPKKIKQNEIAKNDIAGLLKEQTNIILTAVDSHLEKLESRFNRKLDQLITTLDRFLKRLTDTEDEFAIMKKDLNQIKEVLKEKLDIDIF